MINLLLAFELFVELYFLSPIMEFHKLNNQVVIGLREGSYLQVKGDEIYLKGLKNAVIFKKENEKFEIENGFNLKNII